MVEIKDKEGLAKWLEGQSPTVIKVMVIRNALRSLSHLLSITIGGAPDHIDPTLELFREFAIAHVLTNPRKSMAFSEMVDREYSMSSKSSSGILSLLSYATDTQNSLSHIAEEMDDVVEFVAADLFSSKDIFSLTDIFADNPIIIQKFWTGIGADVTDFSDGKKANDVRVVPLWRSNNPIDHLWEKKKNELRNRTEDWSFWIDWYERFLDGRPQNWDMLEEIALIDPEDWDKGAAHVNPMIERIRKRYDLEAEIAKLKEHLKAVKLVEAPPHRLDNNPPEPIENEKVVRKEITLIWGQLYQLEEEIQKPEPPYELLDKIAETLWAIAKRIIKYCASLGDRTLKKGAEQVGISGVKWGIGAGATWWTAQTEGVQSVAKAIGEFLKTLPPT